MLKASRKTGTRERNKQDKLMRIKSSALELFVSKGFDDTTTREIASAAGVGLGTVFVYAETKRDLLFLIVNDDLEDCVDRSSANCDPSRSLLQNILEILRIHYEYFARLPVLSRQALREMYFYQTGKQAERFIHTRERLSGLIGKLIAEAIATRLIHSEESADIIAQTIFAIYQVDLRRWLSTDDLDIEAAMLHLGRQLMVLMRGLSPRPEALA
ncbi:TetR/AcrR family transcriptional regulator [Rhizobium sp. AU243]|uniref:TetR/AcrR family transcriptional regulator n=1 Tax=Rhizobium sp. AU243 TaxID=2303425 RepID=UPI0010CC6B3B|nr:TetR/AcrR family transcriptional regulator [Rhizobium sp. AU243]TKV70763.1 TetR/AcrR family transcriptional regulator [Rhizobium sp. AU243]